MDAVQYLPFDEPKPVAPAKPPPPLRVSQVAELIRAALEDTLPVPLRVVGEVSGLTCRDHWYFSLKDAQAVIRCVAWASSARSFGFVPGEGTEVVATGHVSYYGAKGSTQLYVSHLVPVGAGALELRFRAMCDELRRLGYFDEARKKPLPAFPRRIAVVTSRSGAALQDVLATAAQRCPAVAIVVVDVRVQGDGAAAGIAAAIARIDLLAAELELDAILVTRGGGSPEDLWAFNERAVADAAYRCRLPLVAAIGHESDTTVIELVADVRAATPTQAVMRLVPDASELRQQVEHLRHRLQFLVGRYLERERERLAAAARCPLLRDPRAALNQARKRLDERRERLERAMRRRGEGRPALLVQARRLTHAMRRHVRRLGERAGALQQRLEGVSPLGVLGRGYSLTTTADGRLVGSVHDVEPGAAIVTQVRDGSIESLVERSRAASALECKDARAADHSRRAP